MLIREEIMEVVVFSHSHQSICHSIIIAKDQVDMLIETSQKTQMKTKIIKIVSIIIKHIDTINIIMTINIIIGREVKVA